MKVWRLLAEASSGRICASDCDEKERIDAQIPFVAIANYDMFLEVEVSSHQSSASFDMLFQLAGAGTVILASSAVPHLLALIAELGDVHEIGGPIDAGRAMLAGVQGIFPNHYPPKVAVAPETIATSLEQADVFVIPADDSVVGRSVHVLAMQMQGTLANGLFQSFTGEIERGIDR